MLFLTNLQRRIQRLSLLPKGVGVAVLVLAAWSTLFFYSLFRVDLSRTPWSLTVLLVYVINFLFIGLFITAHDSMHGTVAPKYPKINRFFGALCAALYGAFTLSQLCEPHLDHHRFPATPRDPDYDGVEGRSGALIWWLKFFWRYFKFRQLVILAVTANLFIHLLGVSDLNVIAFWVIPSVLSSIQLFYFGTYLPHRRLEADPHRDAHSSRSNDYPERLSFLTCYHFGYHWEHHAAPHVPWWGLPAYARGRKQKWGPTLDDPSKGPSV